MAARKELARLALRRRDCRAAADWANQAIQIDVKDAELHRVFAEALASGHNYAEAVEEYRAAIELAPESPRLRMGLADAQIESCRHREARHTLESLLELTPDYPGTDALLESLKETDPP